MSQLWTCFRAARRRRYGIVDRDVNSASALRDGLDGAARWTAVLSVTSISGIRNGLWSARQPRRALYAKAALVWVEGTG